MNKFIQLLFTGVLLLSGCRETPVAIDLSDPIIPLKDSTYIDGIAPTAQYKAVLIEDITGVRCKNCPDAAQKAADIITQKTTDSVVVVAQYPTTVLNTFTFPWPGVPQLASEVSHQIVEALGVPLGLPNGYIDRKIFTGKTERYLSYIEWVNFVNERLKEKTPVNIHISKELNNRNLKVEIKLQYNETVTKGHAHKYAIYLTESKIVSTQQYNNQQDVNYVHNHALRYAFGLPLGNPLKETLVAGRTFVKQFEYILPNEYIIGNCHLVCVVLDGVTEEVINVREIDL